MITTFRGLFFCHVCMVIQIGLGASASAAENATRPNILFIIFDDWNGSTHAGAYGCDWLKTPNFDRIAREGVLFKNALSSLAGSKTATSC